MTARRVLAVLECRASDEDVVRRAVESISASGGYLTLVAVAPRPFPFLNASPYCCPRVTRDELRRDAHAALARAAALVPPDIPMRTHVDEGRPRAVAARYAKQAACDLVVTRRTLIPKEA